MCETVDHILFRNDWEGKMLKARQILLVVFAGVLAIGSAAITVGARTYLDDRSDQTMFAHSSNVHTRSAAHRHHHHHRRSSVTRSKRLPNANSLKKESW